MTSSASTATARRTATFLRRQQRQTQGFREEISSEEVVYSEISADSEIVADGVSDRQPAKLSITLLWIPPGRFWMGSPPQEPERQETEGPQHLVQLQGFFMGQTPITQAQWQRVAQWQEREGEHWSRHLQPQPSFFQPDTQPGKAAPGALASFRLLEGETTTNQRPVESVSWQDAMEFCSRLSQRTGRFYTLPSEAQWEYACRAGISKPFHFDGAITPQLANYDGEQHYIQGYYDYAPRPKASIWRQTTPVGMFPANAWGLQEMHGNVWEWCLDEWHHSYEGAPVDGSAWRSANAHEADTQRLLRGGHWGDWPSCCRSACRGHNQLHHVSNGVGFRVVCLPQERSASPLKA